MVVEKPTPAQKAELVAIIAAGLMASHEAWRAWEHEQVQDDTFEQWAIRKALPLAKEVWSVANQ